MQELAQLLQLGDQPIDFLHRSAGNALQQRRDVVRDELAVAFGRAPQSLSVTADELADLALNPIFARVLVVLGLG
jgi:hypothetical protein